MLRAKEETYYFVDKDGQTAERVEAHHRSIGKYVVRASVLMNTCVQAMDCSNWLNDMVANREGVTDRFKVVNYKSSRQTYVVVRKLLVDDLVSGIDEFVEVKQRSV